ncbi:hypothetical protein GUMBALL_56 [Mycobacterium phage Gumball]|uniref:Uncharacterized protein n=2 Tax=Plotvirus plot TaxID=2170099 RepID=B5U3T4_9CAUD|nr:gp58 [Mycobacterium phage Gumball]ACI06430.1 hypothetical protein GUMBALL_56 [Mycobacterium phage Gumball]AEK10267.1 hypothetical protein PBI_SIRHARLEY_58 [Mycobacterium phage SirHarley]
MKLKVLTFIACEQCGTHFGGPEAGEYDYRNLPGKMTIAEYLVEEALASMWIRVIWGADDVILCGPDCVKSWLDEVVSRGN